MTVPCLPATNGPSRRQFVGAGAAFLVAALCPAAVRANPQEFAAWLDELRREALAKGVSRYTVDEALANIEPIARVLELDRKQPEFTLTFRDYMARVVNDARVEKGRRLAQEHKELLDRISRKYGVLPRFIVALWGIESDYGRLTGGFSVIGALATLAYDGRRSAFFRTELFNALKIIDAGHIGPQAMTGSWAGAMGQSQFMPSSFLSYAVDHDGDGRRDIWASLPDIFASIANYLARSGWNASMGWGWEVRLPEGFDASLASLEVKKTLTQWQDLGVRRADGSDLPPRALSASVVRPAEDAAFLVYDNYRVIMKWNRSLFFATAAGILADRIGGI